MTYGDQPQGVGCRSAARDFKYDGTQAKQKI
jgi:hypothetical protein